VNAKNRNLVVRIITAVTLLPLVLWLIYQGGLFSGGLLGVAAAACAYEFHVITQKKLTPPGVLSLVIALALPILAVTHPARVGEFGFWLLTVFIVLAWTYHLVRGPLAQGTSKVAELLLGLLYATAGLTALSLLRNFHHGFDWVFCALVVTWGNDTAAYFAGRFLGKHKLYPAVSPNKTWEGFFGGMAGSIGGLFFTKAFILSELGVWDCLIMGVLGGILGPLGDLCESMLKRAYDVKDSGKMLPGHGGLLDRIDALLFNAPMVFLYARFVWPWLHG
jgi:phosphatidate cytidylyltransferase